MDIREMIDLLTQLGEEHGYDVEVKVYDKEYGNYYGIDKTDVVYKEYEPYNAPLALREMILIDVY